MRLTSTAPCGRDDAGLTLVELLMTVVILGVIALPLGNAIIGVLKNTDATSDRLSLSHDAQISAAYFARDVASVGTRDYSAVGTPLRQSIQRDAAYNAGGHTCGTATTPTAKVRFLADRWDNSGSAPTMATDVVAYYLVPAGSISELHRIKCTGSSTPASDVTLAHYVDPATLTVACSTTCEAATAPQRVTLTFWVVKPSAEDISGGMCSDPVVRERSCYEINLSGQRRQT